MRFCNFLTRCNSSTMKGILQAGMQLGARSNACWSSHELTSMKGLAHSHIFKQDLLNGKRIDHSHFVMDFKNRHLHYWEPFSSAHLQDRKSKIVSN